VKRRTGLILFALSLANCTAIGELVKPEENPKPITWSYPSGALEPGAHASASAPPRAPSLAQVCRDELDAAIDQIEVEQPRRFTPVERKANAQALLEMGMLPSCAKLGQALVRRQEREEAQRQLEANEKQRLADDAARQREKREYWLRVMQAIEAAQPTVTTCDRFGDRVTCTTR